MLECHSVFLSVPVGFRTVQPRVPDPAAAVPLGPATYPYTGLHACGCARLCGKVLETGPKSGLLGPFKRALGGCRPPDARFILRGSRPPVGGCRPPNPLRGVWGAAASQPGVRDHPGSSRLHYGKGFDAGPPQVGAGSLSFCGFSRFSVVFLPAFLFSRLYVEVCVLVAVFLSTENSLYVVTCGCTRVFSGCPAVSG